MKLFLQILISDNGVPPLSSMTRVVVKVEDINDNAPEFEQVSYDIQIPPSSDENQPLFQVRKHFVLTDSFCYD